MNTKASSIPEECWVWPFTEFRDLLKPTTDAPDEFKYFSLLTFIGLICGQNFYIDYAYHQHLNFYTCIVANTGKGKTAVLKALWKLFKAMQLKGLNQDIILLPNISTSEYLYEQLVGLQGSPRVLILNDEFKRMLVSAQRRGTSNFFPDLNQLFDVPESWSPGTKSQAKKILSPMLSMVSAINREDLIKNIDEGFISGGTLNRILFIEGTSNGSIIPRPKSPAQEDLNSLAEKIVHRFRSFRFDHPNLITMDEEAEILWDANYHAWHERQLTLNPVQLDLTKRSDAYAYRLAAVYALIRESLIITGADISRAWKLIEYAIQECLDCLGQSLSLTEDSRGYHRVVEIISQKPGISRSEIYLKVKHLMGAEKLSKIVGYLVKIEKLTEKEVKTPGLTKKVYWLRDDSN